MSIAHLLTEFSADSAETETTRLISELELEEERLAAFERGYSAGWEDAITAQGRERAEAIARVKQSLEDLSFTYHEAHGQMILSLRQVVGALVTQVLPRALVRSMASRLTEELTEMIAQDGGSPVEIRVAPGLDPDLESAIASVTTIPLAPVEDSELAPGQIVLRIGEDERELDLDRLLDGMKRAVEGYFEQLELEMTNG